MLFFIYKSLNQFLQRVLIIKKNCFERTHKIFIVIIISVINDTMAVPLIESAQSTGVIMLGINSAPALKARLPQALIEALAQTSPSDFRVKFATQT